jgi:hypothetical protein
MRVLFSLLSRPTLGPFKPRIQQILGVKRMRREADHSPPATVEVKNGGAVLLLPHTSSWRCDKLIIYMDKMTRGWSSIPIRVNNFLFPVPFRLALGQPRLLFNVYRE